LDPEVLARISGLELKAKLIVEGFVSGLHRSPFRGFSVEFAEHREYVPGDDLRFLDWKVYGRTDRLYIKRYEEETNLEATILLDASESMSYRDASGRSPSKFDTARWAAAALAYLIVQQQDSVGLVLFDERVRATLPATTGLGHLQHLVSVLERAAPASGTGIGRALSEAAEAVRRRGLLVVFSDLLDDAKEVARGLAHARRRGHEVIVFHLLAGDEVAFPFDRTTRFEGMESLPPIVTDPASLRQAYLDEVASFKASLRRTCLANRIDLVETTTSDSLGVVLATYLARRASRWRARA
jgi:uncharacterized protein (DUF58 family)